MAAFPQLLEELRSPQTAFVLGTGCRCGLTLRAASETLTLGCMWQKAAGDRRARYFQAAVSSAEFAAHQTELGVSGASAATLAAALVGALGSASCELQQQDGGGGDGGGGGGGDGDGSAFTLLVALSYAVFGGATASFTLREIPGGASPELADAVFAWLPGSCSCEVEAAEEAAAGQGGAQQAAAAAAPPPPSPGQPRAHETAGPGQKRKLEGCMGASSLAAAAQPAKAKKRLVQAENSGVQYEDDSSSDED
jgi:hypothetical protein